MMSKFTAVFLGVWVCALATQFSACTSTRPLNTPEATLATLQTGLPLASMLAATPAPAYGDLPQFIPVHCPFVLPDGYSQGEDVDCGYLLVPETRTESGGRVVRLAVAVFHPPGGAGHPDPIVYLSGGPGASALELIQYQFEDVYEPIMKAAGRDLVIFDQRGVGLSQPALDCPEMDDLIIEIMDRQIDGKRIDDHQAGDYLLQKAQACRENLSQVADLTAYHSVAGAGDVEDLRLALGYHRINLWGGSYGSRLGLEVVRLYPQGLRSVVLEAVYPPDVDLYLEAPANFDRSLELLFADCEANEVCAHKYPDLRRVFYETVERLEVAPQMRLIEDPFTKETYDALLDGDTLMGMVFQILYESRLRYLLPELIYDASRGEFGTFDLLRGSLIGQLDISSRGMMFSVQCHEELAFSSLPALEDAMQAYPHLARMFEHAIVGKLPFQACEFWGAGRAEPAANQPVDSDLPLLLMAGEFDPITPPAWAFHAAETLANGYVYQYPGIGHGATPIGGCPRDMMIAFLENPNIPPDDYCIAEMEE